MEQSPEPGRDQTADKAYAAAIVAVLLYIVNGLVTGEWASVQSIAPALTIVVAPFVVWFVPNRVKE